MTICASDRARGTSPWILVLCVLAFSTRPLSADEPAVRWLADTITFQDGDSLTGDVGSDDPLSSGLDELDQLLNSDISTLRRTSVAPALDVEVSTVSRQKSTVGRSPTAVFVVDQEMIRRSGARTVPDLLRLVPGLHVARIDANRWSVSSRGFAGRFSNKLLVQIDGRSVYTPLFAGVYWDVQDLVLADIERIEVIRGPGATVWGANAVNGIINIITKSARETHGVYALGGGGTEERGFATARIGNVTDRGVHWRVWGKWFERDAQFESTGIEFDDWRQGRFGFRTDWSPNCCDSLTLQGDVYSGASGFANTNSFAGFRAGDDRLSGADLLGRWTRTYSQESDMSVQVYYDRTDRASGLLDANINMLDVDFQHRFPLNWRHRIIWGLGYRRVWDNLPSMGTPPLVTLNPVSRTMELFSGFVQDAITLSEDYLYFTIGTKLLDNAFTDFEIQPSARLLWLVDEQTAAWASVSRAVRTPSRFEHDGSIIIGQAVPGVPITLVGNRGLESDELLAYEAGVRRQPVDWFSWDLALFYNVYEDLNSEYSVAPFPPVIGLFNGGSAHGYGLELAATVEMTECWQIRGWYSLLRFRGDQDPASLTLFSDDDGDVVNHQAFVMSSWNLGYDYEFDLLARYVDAIRNIGVPSYISLDARLAYRLTDDLEFSLVGQNLLDSHHPEYATSGFVGDVVTEVERSIYGMIVWEY